MAEKFSTETELGHEVAVWAHKGKVDWDVNLWKEVVDTGRKIERPIMGDTVHTMSPLQVDALIRPFEFHPPLVGQLQWDMNVAKYRLYDELGMLIMSRTKGYGQPPEIELKAQKIAEKMGQLYLQCTKQYTERTKLYQCFTELVEKEKW